MRSAGSYRLIWIAAAAATLTPWLLLADPIARVRVPAEWEPHSATWMQWPGPYETALRPAFADIIKVVSAYEPLHLLNRSAAEQKQAKSFLQRRGDDFENCVQSILDQNQ